MELILFVIFIIFIFKIFGKQDGESRWDNIRKSFNMSGYSDLDWKMMKAMDDPDLQKMMSLNDRDEEWSPVLSRKYERTMGDDLPDEIVQVYEVLVTVWQNFACEGAFRPIFESLEKEPEAVVQEIERSDLSIPMWVYTTIKINCEADTNENKAILRLIDEVNVRIDEEQSVEDHSEDSSEAADDLSDTVNEDVVDISIATVHLQRLEKEVDELRMNLVDLYEKVERLEAEAALNSNAHEVEGKQIDHEVVENAEVERESAEQEKSFETEEETIESKIATLEAQGSLETEEEKVELIIALNKLGNIHFEKDDWDKAEPYYVRASDLIEEWKLFDNFQGASEPLIINLTRIYKESRRHYEASRLGIRFKH